MTEIGREAYERGPQWTLLGQQILEARERLGMGQAALARAIGANQTTVSRDERGFGMSNERVQAYCKFFHWDHDKVRAFLDGEYELPPAVKAKQEYLELFQLLDGKLLDGEEQDLIDEALQLVILHRYPGVSVSDFAIAKDAED